MIAYVSNASALNLAHTGERTRTASVENLHESPSHQIEHFCEKSDLFKTANELTVLLVGLVLKPCEILFFSNLTLAQSRPRAQGPLCISSVFVWVASNNCERSPKMVENKVKLGEARTNLGRKVMPWIVLSPLKRLLCAVLFPQFNDRFVHRPRYSKARWPNVKRRVVVWRVRLNA